MSFVIALLYIVLVPLSIFLVLVVLMQKSKSDGSLGAALGGGASEAAFGPDTSNVLATVTRNGTIAFFVICFCLYLAQIARHTDKAAGGALPMIEAPAELPVVIPVEEALIEAPVIDGAIEAEPAQ